MRCQALLRRVLICERRDSGKEGKPVVTQARKFTDESTGGLRRDTNVHACYIPAGAIK